MEQYWNVLGDKILKIDDYYHSLGTIITIDDRLKGIRKAFMEILAENSGNCQALEYIMKRKHQDEKLEKIQSIIKKEVADMLQITSVYPVSSFTAGTNLIGDSDLDFAVTVDKLDDESLIEYIKKFGEYQYQFTETRNAGTVGVHYVFQKFAEGIEIEVKLREKAYFESIVYPIHKYIDSITSEKDKETITWVKYNLKKVSKKAYDSFKILYYENVLECIGKNCLLYPLK